MEGGEAEPQNSAMIGGELLDSNTIIYSAQTDAAGRAVYPNLRKWIRVCSPYVCDVSYRECLTDWPGLQAPTNTMQRHYLESFFLTAQALGHYLRMNPKIEAAAATFFPNMEEDDARIAALAAEHGLTLVTADKALASAAQRIGVSVRPYAFAALEMTFDAWTPII